MDSTFTQTSYPTPSDSTLDSSSTVIESPDFQKSTLSPYLNRSRFHRRNSVTEHDTEYHGAGGGDGGYHQTSSGQGLGISDLGTPTITPGSADPLLPSPWSSPVYKDFGDNKAGGRHTKEGDKEYTVDLHGRRGPPSTPTSSLALDRNYKGKSHRRLNGLILAFSVYSSVFSGIWLYLAITKPRYGHLITTNGPFSPNTASVVFAAFAKTVELTFVTVFVAFLGQVLTTRAMKNHVKGVTLADMSMRSWIMQPGTIFTHWETLRYSALTFIGILTLTGTLTAMLYTTASDALVTPKLKFGGWEHRQLYGRVVTSFANKTYINEQCQTPIDSSVDPVYAASTCIQIEHPGQAYHNYLQYLGEWSKNIARRNGSDDIAKRPMPTGMFHDNTTVQGAWLYSPTPSELSKKYSIPGYQRIIINVTMAMPHSGVFAAARDPINKIMQPQDLVGLGEYFIDATIPSPATNVLCASLKEEELSPMVYSKWPEYRQDDPETASKYPDIIPKYPSWLNETSVDDLFEFGERYGRRHPVFQKLPIPYNSIVNVTGSFIDSIYVLITSPDSTYMLCSMRATLAADCSTVYDASMSGGHMNARCGDDMAYASPDPRNGVVSKDWANVATDWALSLALNTGISDANSSNARLLAQLIPTTPSLNATLPSIAEALAVLSGCTLLQSTIDAPFTSTSTYLDETIMHQNRQYQRFEAKVRTQDYSSGSSKPWQNAFFVILGPTFAINLICLSYLAVKSTITDFMEPQNMFALSLNSQRSQELNNASGEGPKGKQFATNWFIKWNTDTEHLSIESERASPTDIYTPEIVVEDDKESAWRRASGHAPRVGGRPKFPLTKARSLREGE